MDLRCRLESNERDWLREKAELLEKFNSERREWESQIRDMQRKIEELYCEVKVKRDGTRVETGVDSCTQDDEDITLRLSVQSTSTASSLLSNQSNSGHLSSSSSQSEPPKHPPLPGFYQCSNISSSCGSSSDRPSHCYRGNSFCEPNVDGHFSQNDCVKPEQMDDQRSRAREHQPIESAVGKREAVDAIELEAILHGAAGHRVPEEITKGNVDKASTGHQGSPQTSELSFGSEKKKNTTALNAALKEIARVSEELCSYQDEIRKKTEDKSSFRSRIEGLQLSEEKEIPRSHGTSSLEMHESTCDLNQIYDDLRALQKESWITWSPENTLRVNSRETESWRTDSYESESWRTNSNETHTNAFPEMQPQPPPIPPRSTSWYLSSPTPPDPDLVVPESSVIVSSKCHSPCALVDKKGSSPSIVRKFEAMLQENEGKVLTEGVVVSCLAPTNSNCNVGCCHNRWSCDANKFVGKKLSSYSPVQKSFSEVNILTAGKEFGSDHRPAVVNLKSPDGHQNNPPVVKELPVDLLLPSLEKPSVSPNLQGSKRNIMLEQKTAEFNRTLFQAEMGRGVEEPDNISTSYVSSAVCQPLRSPVYASDEVVPPSTADCDLLPQCAEVTSAISSVCAKATLGHTSCDLAPQNPQVQLRRKGSDPQGQEVTMLQEVTPDLSPLQTEVRHWESQTATSHTPAHHHPEVKHKAGALQTPSRHTQHRATTETLPSGYSLPPNILPVQNAAAPSPKREKKSQRDRAHPAEVGGSPQQQPTETKLRQTGRLGRPGRATDVSAPQTDTPRAGPRVLTDHPWKPLTLAAYPRPEGSRSNYGAVERILKSYESAAWAQQNPYQQSQTVSSPNLSPRQEEKIIQLLDMLDVDPAPDPSSPRLAHSPHISHAALSQHSSQAAMGTKKSRHTVQESKGSSVFSSSTQKNFSRPACPANRRLPSRWASRSPSSSSSTSSSPSTTPVHGPSIPIQKHASSFCYSAYHTETVII